MSIAARNEENKRTQAQTQREESRIRIPTSALSRRSLDLHQTKLTFPYLLALPFLTTTPTTRHHQGLLSATVQDAIMGGAVLATAGAAAWAVGRGDAPVGCSLCQGTGGCSCFACAGSGNPASTSSPNSRPLTMEEVAASREEIERANGGKKPPQRDFFGRAPTRVGARGAGLQCRVCGGTGLVLCSQCKGSGFTRM